VWNTTGGNLGTNITQGGRISLQGTDADLDINGKSLKQWMEQVEERLNIITPNLTLEKEWDDLRELGERYRELEKKCKEKAEMWKKLKSMPAPRPEQF
jgi:flagellar motility protein MotE (MotC chaperone)